jgi:ABC-type transport system substrate-binding protein
LIQRTKKELRLEAFDQHWRGKASIKQVVFSALPARMSFEQFKEGNLDVYRLLPASLVKQSPHGVHIIGRSGLAVMYLWFNCSPEIENHKNPFGDVRIRQAISLALDRDRIVQKLGGSDTTVNQLIPEGVFGFIPSWKDLPHDPESAKRLVKEAGYPNGFQTSFTHPPGESYEQLAIILKELLAPVGIRLQSKELPFVDFLDARRNQQLPFFALTWTFDDGDAWTFLMASLHSKAGPQDFRSTNPGYTNPQVDRLIEESQQVSNVSDIAERYENILKIAIKELPIIPLYRRYDFYGTSQRVRFNPRLDGKLLAAEMELVD